MLIFKNRNMKIQNIILKLVVIPVMLIMFAGCKKNFLDRQPLDRISSSAVFTDKALTEAYLYDLYSKLPVGFTMYNTYGEYGIFMLANVSDEARSKSTWISSETTVVPGLIKSTDNPLDIWAQSFMPIRIANNIIL